jgi:hypothetical protein
MAVVVFFLSLAASTLQFAARSQVLSGKPVEETFQLEFTLDADSTHTYPVNPQLKAVLEQGIKFMTEGPVRIASAKVEITPKDVSWTSDRTTYTSTGAGLVAHVKWDTPRDSANGAHGIIYIRFPEISGLDAKGPTFHSGGYQRDDQDQYVLREINTYQSGLLVSLARFSFALAAGVPVGIALHCIYWAFVLRNEKRSRLAEIALQGTQLPRTFYPNPIAEWTTWTIVFGILAFCASMFAVFGIADGFMSSSMVWAVYIVLGVGAVLALGCVYLARRSLWTVRVDPSGVSYARGRGDLQWLTAGWKEILQLTEKSRVYRGTTRYWLVIQFKDRRTKLKISHDIVGYADLKKFLFSALAPAN